VQNNANRARDNPDMATSLDHILAANLRPLREAAGLTREQLAERAAVSIRTVANAELATSSATLSTVARLAAVLRCEPWQLLYPGFHALGRSDPRAAAQLLTRYLSLPADARDQVHRVAEAEARYAARPAPSKDQPT
jgi:transcriptional regulator with XRE-family HTH domain